MDNQLKSGTVDTVMNEVIPEPRLIGYARVSTDDQDLSLQIDALTKQGIPEPQAAVGIIPLKNRRR
jgi:predicted site-specific integrase-resolvase